MRDCFISLATVEGLMIIFALRLCKGTGVSDCAHTLLNFD